MKQSEKKIKRKKPLLGHVVILAGKFRKKGCTTNRNLEGPAPAKYRSPEGEPKEPCSPQQGSLR